MSVVAEFAVANPGAVPFTLRMTMPLKSWRAIKEQLDASSNNNGGWESLELRRAISDMVEQANRAYSPRLPEPEPQS